MEHNNDNRQSPDNGLSPEKQQWLDELIKSAEASVASVVPQPAEEEPETPAASTPAEPEEVISDADAELEQILAADWDNITLPDETEVKEYTSGTYQIVK